MKSALFCTVYSTAGIAIFSVSTGAPTMSLCSWLHAAPTPPFSKQSSATDSGSLSASVTSTATLEL